MADVKKLSASDELAEIELELKKLQLEEQRLKNTELQQSINDRKLRIDQTGSKARANARDLASEDQFKRMEHASCNHLKGGMGAEGLGNGDGKHGGASIFKIRLPNGDVVMTCSRCGKDWYPAVEPLREEYKTDVGYQEAVEVYRKQVADYSAALKMQSDNRIAGGPIWQFNTKEAKRKARLAYRSSSVI